MPFRPDDYDGSYCIACRKPFPGFLDVFAECQSCGYFDDGLIDLEDSDGFEPGDAEWMSQSTSRHNPRKEPPND